MIGLRFLAAAALFTATACSSQAVATGDQQPTSVSLRSLPELRDGVEIQDFRLLTATSGWELENNRLLVTADSGSHWKDITPKEGWSGNLTQVVFTSIRNAWVLFINPVDDSESDVEPGTDWEMSIAYTSNQGATWTYKHISYVKGSYAPPSGQANLSFADSLHRWLIYGLTSGSAFSEGVVLGTSDGGETWVETASPGFYGKLIAVSEKELWAVGGADGDNQLAATYDGAANFHSVTISAPKQLAHSESTNYFDWINYGVPQFWNASEGYIVVSFSNFSASKSDQVLYRTNDGGRTWHAEYILSAVPRRDTVFSTMAGPDWLLSSRNGPEPTVQRLSSKSGPPQITHAENLGGCTLSFLSEHTGWMCCGLVLKSTVDGGATWRDITPRSIEKTLMTNH